MKRRVELPVRRVSDVESELLPEDEELQHQHPGPQPRAAREAQPKKRRLVKTSVTTVTTIVTEEVDDEDAADSAASGGHESEQAREERRKLLRQLEVLKEQLLEEERHANEHHHHHRQSQQHHHSGASSQQHATASRTGTHDTSGEDHSLTHRPPFSASPNRPVVRHETVRAQGRGDSVAARPVEIMEKGYVYFLYRPKVGAQEAKSFDDVARMYILLKTLPKEDASADSTDASSPAFYRLIRIGKKKLPSIREHNRFWGIIEEATHDYEKIHHLIVSEHYTTVTLGERVSPSCRPAGEGVYGIVQRDNYSHLAYVLELPHELGEVQKALNIVAEGCFVLSVKNPEALPYSTFSNTLPPKPVPHADTDQGIPLPALDDRRAVQQMIQDQPGLPRRDPGTVPQSPLPVTFPPHLQEAFQGRRFAPALPLEMLDQKGVEVVLIGESDNLAAEFGKLGQELEGEVIDAPHFTDEDLLQELHLTKRENPIEPLRYGTWA